MSREQSRQQARMAFAVLDGHEVFLQQAQSLVNKEIADNNKPYKEFLKQLKQGLGAHNEWVKAGIENEAPPVACPVQWVSVAVERETESKQETGDKKEAGTEQKTANKVVLHITGPTGKHESSVTVDEADADRIESELAAYDNMTNFLLRAAKQASTLLRMQQQKPHDSKVQSHITLLKQYNDIRDVGQQLIGVIAENRGVPVRSMYEEGNYGVGADD